MVTVEKGGNLSARRSNVVVRSNKKVHRLPNIGSSIHFGASELEVGSWKGLHPPVSHPHDRAAMDTTTLQSEVINVSN